MNTSEQEFLSDTTINLDRLPALGKHLKITADAGQLERIAIAANVGSIGHLGADVHIVRVKGGVQVTGRLRAQSIQPCVVTLEPVHQKIDVELNRVFMPRPAKNNSEMEEEKASDFQSHIDLAEEDLPDYYDGSLLDLGDFLLETFAMEIELYPRLPGAKMSEAQKGDDPLELSPFAILKDRDSG